MAEGGTERVPSTDDAGRPQEVQIDLSVAPPTRISAFMRGGDAHFEVDREMAARMFGSVPGGVEGYRAVGRSAQAFTRRAVRHLTADASVRQFLVTGCDLSGHPNVHDIAQAVAPESRAVYVLLDPVMLAHAHVLRRGTPEGASAYVTAKLRDVDEVLRQSAATLDFSQPVALVMPANLSFIRDLGRARKIVDGLMADMVPGSHLMLTHHASDLFVDEHAEMFRTIAALAAEGRTWAIVPRSHDEVAGFFDGLTLLPPGVAPMDEWRQDDPGHEPAPIAVYAAVGRR
jgi:hypothetical protein